MRENVDPVSGCCVWQGKLKASCDTTETILRKLKGLPSMSGSVWRQELGLVDNEELNALFGNPKNDPFYAIKRR